MGLKVVWLGLMLSLLLGCSARQEITQQREPIAVSLEQLSQYWQQKSSRSWFTDDEPVVPGKQVKGFVDVHYLIDGHGMPQAPRIVAAEPPGLLEQSALATLSRMRYSPSASNPNAIPVQVTNRFEMEFN